MSDNTAIILAITSFMSLAVIGFTVMGCIAFYRADKGQAKSFTLMFERGNFLRIGTVVLVIFAVVLLAVIGKLTDGAAAVLSGVAGYVLGGLQKASALGAEFGEAQQGVQADRPKKHGPVGLT